MDTYSSTINLGRRRLSKEAWEAPTVVVQAGRASRTWMLMRFCAISETFSAREEEGRDRDRIQVRDDVFVTGEMLGFSSFF